MDATWDYYVNLSFTRILANMDKLVSGNLIHDKALVPESAWASAFPQTLFSKVVRTSSFD